MIDEAGIAEESGPVCIRSMRLWEWFVTLLTGLSVLASLFWIVQLVEAIRYAVQAIWLADLPAEPPPPDGGWPAVAVIFAARNESEMVERATRSMLCAGYPGSR